MTVPDYFYTSKVCKFIKYGKQRSSSRDGYTEHSPQGKSCFPLGTQFQSNRLIEDLDILREFSQLQRFSSLGMFWYCTNLKRITIPASTVSLYRQLFRYCPSGVIRFILLPTTPPTLDNNDLWVTPQAIYVPAESINAYKESSYWASYVSLFYPLEEA